MDFEVAVVGGGINGAGVVREAAYRGYRTLLVEQHDYAQATSSQSTKLIHGGIRYLEHAEFSLVWESLHERGTLLRIAPHLVKPLELIIPIYKGSPRPPWMVRLGTLLYDVLAGGKQMARSRGVSRTELAAIPYLRQEGLRGAVAYYDAQTHDARLTLETILSAQEAGAMVANYHTVDKVRLSDGFYVLEGLDRRSGRPWMHRSRTVVNATGPWVPYFEAATLRHPTPPMVYDRGIHFVIPSIGLRQGLYLMVPDQRLIFVLPWRDKYTLVGTTESLFKGTDFAHVPPSEEEIRYLLDIFNTYFPGRALKREEILHTYSGVRALIAPKGGTLAGASRESELAVFDDASGNAWAIVTGGKLTSYRSYAAKVMDRLAEHVGPPAVPKQLDTASTPLYGAAEVPGTLADAAPPGVPSEQFEVWKKRYGTRAIELIRRARKSPNLAETVVPSHLFTRADLDYLIDVEQAFLLEDIEERRTKMDYDMTPEERRRLSSALAAAIHARGWKQEAA